MTTPKLKADFFAGEGEIVWPKDWRKLGWLMRADLLKDWIHDLVKEYNRILESDDSDCLKAWCKKIAAKKKRRGSVAPRKRKRA